MMQEQFDVAIGLIITTTIKLELITQIMGIAPTKSVQKCDEKSVLSDKLNSNMWIFRERFKYQSDIDTCMYKFFKSIPNLKDKIYEANRYGSCVLRISLVSEYGQIGFSLSANNIQFLSELDIPVEVSIFSYGQCIDE